MLQSKNLDDQSFDDIVESAVSRLPWLCPQWTDHNAHDPGITIIELMAWYKEMQQYHMNRFTDEMKAKLLKLMNVPLRPAAAARCIIEVPQNTGRHLTLTRLETKEGIPFELCEEIPENPAFVDRCFLVSGDKQTDVFDVLKSDELSVLPFSFAGESTKLVIGFNKRPAAQFRLWFGIEQNPDVPRNPFSSAEQAFRKVEWTCGSGESIEIISDETHALSQSGYITFKAAPSWKKTAYADGDEFYSMISSLTDPGCEEDVRMSRISSEKYIAAQQETWVKRKMMTVKPSPFCKIKLTDALSINGAVTLLVRSEDGWLQITDYTDSADTYSRQLTLDSSNASQDGSENLCVICADPIHYDDLYFNSDGLPGMSIELPVTDSCVLATDCVLVCDTLCEDGVIRPAFWTCVDDFYSCSPRDRVFVYDEISQSITFGDGEHGAVVPKGTSAVLAANFVLSLCENGNIPKDSKLFFEDDGSQTVGNTPAGGGTGAETAAAAAARFIRKLSVTSKCSCADDYESLAKTTPGLCVKAAKAIPGYNPNEPSGSGKRPSVTVVVIPYSTRALPMPDARFLEAVKARLEQFRPICTSVNVIAPKYVGIGVTAQLKIKQAVSPEQIRPAVEKCLSLKADGSGIGSPLIKSEIAVEIQRIPGVIRVSRLEINALSLDCYTSPSGDVTIPKNAVAYLKTIDVDIS